MTNQWKLLISFYRVLCSSAVPKKVRNKRLMTADGNIYDVNTGELLETVPLFHGGKQNSPFTGCGNLVGRKRIIFVMDASGEKIRIEDFRKLYNIEHKPKTNKTIRSEKV